MAEAVAGSAGQVNAHRRLLSGRASTARRRLRRWAAKAGFGATGVVGARGASRIDPSSGIAAPLVDLAELSAGPHEQGLGGGFGDVAAVQAGQGQNSAMLRSRPDEPAGWHRVDPERPSHRYRRPTPAYSDGQRQDSFRFGTCRPSGHPQVAVFDTDASSVPLTDAEVYATRTLHRGVEAGSRSTPDSTSALSDPVTARDSYPFHLQFLFIRQGTKSHSRHQ